MRLLMYSGPSLCLRAFWMAWYSSAVYWLYSPEGNQMLCVPFLPQWSPLSFQIEHLFPLGNTEWSWVGQQQASTHPAGTRLWFHPKPRGNIRHSCIHESKHCTVPYTKPNFMHSLKNCSKWLWTGEVGEPTSIILHRNITIKWLLLIHYYIYRSVHSSILLTDIQLDNMRTDMHKLTETVAAHT